MATKKYKTEKTLSPPTAASASSSTQSSSRDAKNVNDVRKRVQELTHGDEEKMQQDDDGEGDSSDSGEGDENGGAEVEGEGEAEGIEDHEEAAPVPTTDAENQNEHDDSTSQEAGRKRKMAERTLSSIPADKGLNEVKKVKESGGEEVDSVSRFEVTMS